MKKSVVMVLMGISLFAAQAFAQQRTVTGKVTTEQGSPFPGVSVIIKGTILGTSTSSEGTYSIRAEAGQVLQLNVVAKGRLSEPREFEDVVLKGWREQGVVR